MQHNSNHQPAALFPQYKQSTLLASAPIQLYLIYFLLISTLCFFQICASIKIIVSPFLSNSLPPISPSEMFSSCNTSPPPTRSPTLIQSLLFLSTSIQCSTGVLLSTAIVTRPAASSQSVPLSWPSRTLLSFCLLQHLRSLCDLPSPRLSLFICSFVHGLLLHVGVPVLSAWSSIQYFWFCFLFFKLLYIVRLFWHSHDTTSKPNKLLGAQPL